MRSSLQDRYIKGIECYANSKFGCGWAQADANNAENVMSRTGYVMTCVSLRRPLFLHALSFECTSKLCITFLGQFSVFFTFQDALHNLVIEFCSAFKIF